VTLVPPASTGASFTAARFTVEVTALESSAPSFTV
jgi:hypothetical protein